MADLTLTLQANFVVLIAVMCLLWMLSLVRRDSSIVDPFWGTGFIIIGWLSVSLRGAFNSRILLITTLITLWGLRLSLFLMWRNWGHGEDRRYRAMRTYHGDRFWYTSLGTVFLLQGVVLWFVSLPIQVVIALDRAAPLGWLDAVGACIWTVGFYFEAVGDWQLSAFQADPTNAGRVMDRGLWRLTRHPNYFGDFCVWWGIYLIATAGGAGSTIGSPILMSFLLMRVSGVTLLEASITERRPEYAAYRSRTNAFFPGPPKR